MMRLKNGIIAPLCLLILLTGCKQEIDSESATSNVASQAIDDSALKSQLESIRVEDQTLRMLLPAVNEKYERDSPERLFYNRLMQQQDSICEVKITKMLDEHGWLSVDRVGYMANQAQWLVIQHAPIETQEKYLPMLRQSVEKEESDGWYLAFLEDRILMRKGEKQVYGSQAKPNQETGKTHIWPIKNVDEINERRQKIGLEPIEEYAKQNGYVFNRNEHKE